MSHSTMSNGGEPSWAWLGLLKWSLSYSDGTRPSSESVAPMSDTDKAFLEAVMKDGIIDENERMKDVLKQVTGALEAWKQIWEGSQLESVPNTQEIDELLAELRDIVEQIDYARAFSAMQGLPFLLGCAQERQAVPRQIRLACLGVLATMCQNNPPVQLSLLEQGSIRILSELYMKEHESRETDDGDGKARSRIIQVLSASVRNHAMAEQVFCEIESGRLALHLAVRATTHAELHKRGLFFLRALITSDNSSRETVRLFDGTIAFISDHYLNDETEPNAEIREMAIELLSLILEQKKSVNSILSRKHLLVGLGVRRISALRALEGEEQDYARRELEYWETLLVQLSRAHPDDDMPQATGERTLQKTGVVPQ